MNTRERILKAAEARIRRGGYNSFSFRDIARDTELTNAGVHHYFPTKADLVGDVAAQYTERFTEALGDATPSERVARLRALFSDSLKADGQMCLCGLLAAESDGLPDTVRARTRQFFEVLEGLLIDSFPPADDPRASALAVLAQLEGAALLSKTFEDASLFEVASANLLGAQ